MKCARRSTTDETRSVAFDVETTGLRAAKGDRIIEIGAVLLERGLAKAEFHTLVNPGVPVSPGAQSVHGIARQQLMGEPSSHVAMSRFAKFIGNATLIAHNAGFDMRFLRCEFDRLGLSLYNRSQCTLRLSRRRCPGLGSYKLEAVYRHLFGAPGTGVRRHRALDDARLVAKIWLELEQRKGRGQA